MTLTGHTRPIGGLRHRCRNPRCGTKLKRPADNPRDAFCCVGCFESYFRGRCLICERPFKRKRKAEHQRFCRPKCQKGFQRHRERFLGGWYQASVLSVATLRNPIKLGLKIGIKGGRPFRLVAGPALSPAGFRLAALSLDPDVAARVARANAGFSDWLRKSKYAAARRALIKRHCYPVNIVGGYRFLDAPAADLSPAEDPSAVRSQWKPVGWGVAPPLPDFLLRRTPSPILEKAA
jgi:hypothetical protein